MSKSACWWGLDSGYSGLKYLEVLTISSWHIDWRLLTTIDPCKAFLSVIGCWVDRQCGCIHSTSSHSSSEMLRHPLLPKQWMNSHKRICTPRTAVSCWLVCSYEIVMKGTSDPWSLIADDPTIPYILPFFFFFCFLSITSSPVFSSFQKLPYRSTYILFLFCV